MRRALTLVLFLGACGGTAVVDGAAEDLPDHPDSPGAGGDGQPGTPVQPNCQTVGECCAAVCSHAMTYECWQPDDECECGSSGSGESCETAWLELANCILSDLDLAIICSGGDIVLDCSACSDERKLVDAICGGTIGCAI